MSKAIDPFGGQDPGKSHVGENPMLRDDEETVVVVEADWQKRRERAVWYAVAGVGLMFAGSISSALGVGGALMVLFGIFEYIRWSLKRPRKDDPWRDPELDHWEEKVLNGEDLEDAENIAYDGPDSTWGMNRDRF